MSTEQVTLEDFTVDMAKDALAKNNVNRALRKNKMMTYKRDMEEGRWNFCIDPVVFDEDGNLINGQHRLTAQVALGITMRWIVIRHVPRSAQNTMDAGAVRTAADTLHLAGEENAQLMAAVARLVNHLIKGTLAGAKYSASNEEILRCVQDNPVIRRSTEMASRSKGGMTPMPPSVLGAAHWMIRKSNTAAEADAFIYRVTTLTGEVEGSPVLALARRMNELKRNKVRVHARDLLALTIKAWNYDVQGKSAAKLAYHTRAEEFKMPNAMTRDSAFVERDVEDEEETP